MKTCENCGTEHEGTYGSGRFCSSKCARGFSTKAKRKEINEKVSNTLTGSGHENVKLTCKNCETEFEVNWNRRHRDFCSVSCSTKFHMKDKSNFYSDLAKKTGLGGNRNNYAHGWYTSRYAGKVYLESSYEYKVALELDTHGIKWSRPEPIEYSNNKKYYPDFYLIEYDVYLDPKNDYLIKQDMEKINQVQIENNVRVLILDKNNLVWDRIEKIIAGW